MLKLESWHENMILKSGLYAIILIIDYFSTAIVNYFSSLNFAGLFLLLILV